MVYLFGVTGDGSPFLVRDRRAVPYFYVDAAETRRAASLGARRIEPSDRISLGGTPVARVEVDLPRNTPPLRDRLADAGIACYEADVRFALRYLIDRGVRGAVTFEGDGRREEGFAGEVFDDPRQLGPAPPGEPAPRLRVLSFDIETDPRAQRLLSIALWGCGTAEVMLLTRSGQTCPPDATPFAQQGEMIAAFCRRVRELDPDVLTGWSVEDFDLSVLDRLAHRHGVGEGVAGGPSGGLELGRAPGAMTLRPLARGGGVVASIPGRLVLDGPRLLRGSFVRMDSYALDAVAREVLGEGKTVSGGDRAGEILRLFESDRPALVRYNLTDARLALEVLEKLELVELAVERSLLTGLPADRVAGSIAAFDMLYLTELGRRKIVAPTVRLAAEMARAEGGGTIEATGGGHVLDPAAGLWDRVVVLDFKSLYPSLIRTFNIDPLGYVPRPQDRPDGDSGGRGGAGGEPPIVAPNGAAFSRRPGILPRLLDELFPRREAAKAAGDEVKSHAIKILMNSFFGVLGTPSCRFFNPKVANAITSLGRELLVWTQRRIERQHGYRVLYGDTDSLFVATGLDDSAAARRAGEELAAALDRELARHVADRWGVESHLELELERVYRRLFLPPARGGEGVSGSQAGARKRYAGLAEAADGSTRVVLTGLEAVRRDWTALARTLQRELYDRLFHDRPVEEFLRRTVADLRAGRRDPAELVYRKALRKAPEEYTSTTPPHVAAARKLPGRPPRVIRYVMTAAGPEPIALRGDDGGAPLDFEHYVDKQIRPIAEPILALLELDFAKVIGDDRQMELF